MSQKIQIVADENIPLLDELLNDKAHITRVAGRSLNAQEVRHADALLVRSVTQVNQKLLQGSSVQFVGTCTIGVDHIDQAYLQEQGIAFTSAPGCNAMAVVDYVMAAFLALNGSLAYWRNKTVGVLGYGEVGSRLCQRLQTLAIPFKVCDPFKSGAKSSLEEVLACDVISLHVPLTKTGEHPTYQLFNQQRLQQLKQNTVLINTGRGEVVDNQALLDLLKQNRIQAVLDVYQDEPTPSQELLEALDIATAHIAGYSMHGKMRGTLQVVEKLYAYYGWQNTSQDYLAAFSQTLQCEKTASLAQIMQNAYDVRQDSRRFIQHYLAAESSKRAEAFDLYRKNYPTRYELGFTHLQGMQEELQSELKALGFALVGGV